MTTTFAVSGITGLVTDTVDNLGLFDPASFSLVDSELLPNGGREATYQKIDEDIEYPVSVRIGIYPKQGDPTRHNVSLRYSVWVTKVVDTAIVAVEPGHIILAWDMPFNGVPDIDDMTAALQTIISFVFHSVATGSLTTGLLGQLQYSRPELDLSTVSRT